MNDFARFLIDFNAGVNKVYDLLGPIVNHTASDLKVPNEDFKELYGKYFGMLEMDDEVSNDKLYGFFTDETMRLIYKCIEQMFISTDDTRL